MPVRGQGRVLSSGSTYPCSFGYQPQLIIQAAFVFPSAWLNVFVYSVSPESVASHACFSDGFAFEDSLRSPRTGRCTERRAYRTRFTKPMGMSYGDDIESGAAAARNTFVLGLRVIEYSSHPEVGVGI